MDNMNRIAGRFIGCEGGYHESAVALFGAPFDGTSTFRPGSRFAPSSMRAESIGIETYSPYQDNDLTDHAIYDGGDLELIFGNAARSLEIIEKYTALLLLDGKIPCMLGGEHLVSLGAIRAAAAKYPDLYIVHFDAHADLRSEYLGEALSHACVIRRAWEIVGDGRIFQFGIRSGEKSEFLFAQEHCSMTKFNFEHLDMVIYELKGKPVYLTIDLDVLDSSVFPGTGTPEAGGVSFCELLQAMLSLSPLNIVACDLCELSPMLDPGGASTATACKLLRELLLCLI